MSDLHFVAGRPRLLDLFCCAGGAAVGYARAGFDVVGVDVVEQKRYPFEFVRADAIEFVLEHGSEFDVIHASPPCQAYSVTRHSNDIEHPDLLAPTRDALRAVGRPYVIENVEGAPMIDPLLLCGSMFALKAIDTSGERLALRRHRLFESSVFLMGAGGCAHDSDQVAGVYGGGASRRHRGHYSGRGGYTPAASVRNALMGIDWMSQWELTQAIPPAYTEFIGAQLIDELAHHAENAPNAAMR